MGHQTLAATKAKTERFLIEAVNLEHSEAEHRRIMRDFAEFLPASLQDSGMTKRLRDWLLTVYPYGAPGALLKERVEVIDGETWIFGRPTEVETQRFTRFIFLLYLKLFLKSVWDSSDQRTTAQWQIFGTRLFFRGATESGTLWQGLVEPPAPSPFESAMIYLLENLHRTRRCKNSSCVIQPYFFSTKKGQEYCSISCRDESQREIQRRWWSEHGKEWRKTRKRKGNKK